MRIYQHQVCDRCLPIRHKTSDGTYGPSVEEWLTCDGYKTEFGRNDINSTIAMFLEEDGGCQKCVQLFSDASPW
ncbi:MAG: hypothetical protein FWC16_07710 [Defluviitaleaceae bacterium]|nr:hypothetical protein [Defluviitaleaceae bacterium]MCL2274801.1 hypothetical protein [Defluviitaleaceae bacterium]